jgi:hypothetical protein
VSCWASFTVLFSRLTFDLLFQWLGLVIIFLVAMAVSRSRSPRCAHWLAAFSVVLGIGVRLATGQYATGGYPPVV